MEALALESLDPEIKRKYDLVRSVGEECVTDSELRNLVAKKPGFILYDGFEPSGRMHIAQVLCCSFPSFVSRQRSRFAGHIQGHEREQVHAVPTRFRINPLLARAHARTTVARAQRVLGALVSVVESDGIDVMQGDGMQGDAGEERRALESARSETPAAGGSVAQRASETDGFSTGGGSEEVG